MRKILSATGVVVMTLVVSTGVAHGHAPPPEHEHFLTVPGNGKVVRVGPLVCGSPQLHDAFHNFHNNVHVGTPTGIGPLVITPQFCE